MAKKKVAKKKTAATFEQSLEELEEAVAALESGELGLDESLEQYKRGVERLQHCHEQLQQAEQQIALLCGVDADGNPLTEPLDATAASASEDQKPSRAGRRSRQAAGAPPANGVDDRQRLF